MPKAYGRGTHQGDNVSATAKCAGERASSDSGYYFAMFCKSEVLQSPKLREIFTTEATTGSPFPLALGSLSHTPGDTFVGCDLQGGEPQAFRRHRASRSTRSHLLSSHSKDGLSRAHTQEPKGSQGPGRPPPEPQHKAPTLSRRDDRAFGRTSQDQLHRHPGRNTMASLHRCVCTPARGGGLPALTRGAPAPSPASMGPCRLRGELTVRFPSRPSLL